MQNNNDYEIQNLLKILQKKLLKINFEFKSQEQNLDIDTFLEIVAHIYINYSKKFYSFLLKNGFSLFSLTDYKLVENIILIQTKLFSNKPNLTINQFFNHGYIKHKILFCIESIDCLKNWLKDNGVIIEKKKNKKKILERNYFGNKKKNDLGEEKYFEKKNNLEGRDMGNNFKDKMVIKNNLYSGLNLDNLKKEKLEEEENHHEKNFKEQNFKEKKFEEENFEEKKIKNIYIKKTPKKIKKNSLDNKNNKILIKLIMETNKNLSLLSENFKNTTNRLENRIMNLEAKLMLMEKKNLIKK